MPEIKYFIPTPQNVKRITRHPKQRSVDSSTFIRNKLATMNMKLPNEAELTNQQSNKAGTYYGNMFPGSTKHKKDVKDCNLVDRTYRELDNKIKNNEKIYCFCNYISYGNMVKCDNSNCPIQWFHFHCVGLRNLPKGIKIGIFNKVTGF